MSVCDDECLSEILLQLKFQAIIAWKIIDL